MQIYSKLVNLSFLDSESCQKGTIMARQNVSFILIQKFFIVSTTTKQLYCIGARFEQPGYAMYRNLEQLLVKACQKEDITSELQQVCSFYKDDFQLELLQAQLTTFGNEFQRAQRDSPTSHTASKTPTIFDIKDYFTTLTGAQRSLLSQVCSAVKLILVMPASNSTSERSFSTLRRVKTYLRSTMTQQRLNNIMVLNVHKEITDSIKPKDIANEFVGGSEHRLKIFGHFK